MFVQIIVPSVGDPFYFAPSPRELVFQVHTRRGVMRKFAKGTRSGSQFLGLSRILFPPFESIVHPSVEMTWRLGRWDKVLEFHLFEFRSSKYGMFEIDFVSKRFANLRDSKRRYQSGDPLTVQVVEENTLCRFRA